MMEEYKVTLWRMHESDDSLDGLGVSYRIVK